MTRLCARLVKSILEILDEVGQVTVIGNNPGFRERVVTSTIITAAGIYEKVAVIDWYGSYRQEAIPAVEPILPYRRVTKYLPLAISSIQGLYKIGALVEGLVYEAVRNSENFSQVISQLETLSSRNGITRSILSKLILLKEYFTEEVDLPAMFHIDLGDTTVLIRRPLSQLWAAFVSEAIRSQDGLLVISEAGRVIKHGWWVWSLIDEARAKGTKVLLVDDQLLRVYLRHALVFTDFRPLELLAAHRYRLQALTKDWRRGKALLIKDPAEPRSLRID